MQTFSFNSLEGGATEPKPHRHTEHLNQPLPLSRAIPKHRATGVGPQPASSRYLKAGIGIVAALPRGRSMAEVEGIRYTRFERARIIGARALQISMGAPLLIEVPSGIVDPIDIADLEFRKGVLPITVKR